MDAPPYRQWQRGFLAIAILLALNWYLAFAGDSPRLGDGLEFTAVSSHLGVAHPTGYPVYTFFGWIVQHFPLGSPYAKMLAISKVALVGAVSFLALAIRRALMHQTYQKGMATVATAAFVLVVALSDPFRDAVRSAEVYALNAFFLAAIAWLVCVPVTTPKFGARLVAASLLMGISAANHLTSLCMAPLIFIQTLSHARAEKSIIRAVICAALIILIPVLLYGSLALRGSDPAARGIFWGTPFTFSRLLTHVRGGEYRTYQFMQVIPGTSFTPSLYWEFATQRFAVFARTTGSLLFGNGPTSFFAGVGIWMATAYGFVLSLRRPDIRWGAIGIAIAIVAQIAFVFTYNIPDISDYFLGVFVPALPFSIAGLLVFLNRLFTSLKLSVEKSFRATALIIGMFGLMGIISLAQWPQTEIRDPVGSWLNNITAELPTGAAILTAGDDDTYPLWYLQFAEHKREDLFVFGANFIRFPWFRRTLPPGDPRTEAVKFVDGAPPTLQQYIRQLKTNVIDPILPAGPVYTTISVPEELMELRKYYNVVTVKELITQKDLTIALNEGERISPPVLYKIEKRASKP